MDVEISTGVAVTSLPAAARGFAGFGPRSAAFFEGLAADNSRAYFEANREVWEREVRGPLEMLLGELSLRTGGQVKLFRPHRDIRFSRDKSPYKTTTYGVIHSRAGHVSGLYVEVSSRGLYAASGYHEMAADQLARFRSAVADPDSDAGEALAAAIGQVRLAGLEVEGEALKTAPRGFRADHPHVALLRYKSLFAGARLVPLAAMQEPRALEWVAGVWAAAEPLCDWLERHVGESTMPPEVRYGGGRSGR
jgi:uncharacterized protein (TIGR02453 family)